MEILSVEHLNFRYPKSKTNALNEISFKLEQGDFAVLCGATGSGKSTLLRMLKKEISPLGEKSGEISFCGISLEKLANRQSATEIGFVMQRPEQQIVTDKVWHELAFGLENLGLSHETISCRVAEIACYFGIEKWFDRDVSELSGGQKQILSLASVMVMNPKMLILDEPTAQLDPITASDFMNTLYRLNQDFSLTILLSEHRLEDALPHADKLLVMENGRLTADGEPHKVIAEMRDNAELICGMPSASRIYLELGAKGECPLSVREGKRFIQQYKNEIRQTEIKEYTHSKNKALEMKDVYFRYERNLPDILSGLDLTVYEKEFFCILGGNGSGKTTTLSVASGIKKALSGKIDIFGKNIRSYKNQSLYRECVALLPQDVQMLFLCNTVREELEDAKCSAETLPFDLSALMEQHPYDLSGGEQQLLALAKVLAQKPKLLLLDEPAKALDSASKRRLAEVLLKLRDSGMTIVAVTHDVEFASEYADRCAMFFRGKIVSQGEPKQFFSENSFYTTAVSRMTREMYSNAVTVSDAVKLCRINGLKGTENDT